MLKPEMLWVDVETTGLDFDSDVLLEVGITISDRWGNTRIPWQAEWIINDPANDRRILEVMAENGYVSNLHEQSGLWADIQSGLGAERMETEADILAWLNDRMGDEFKGTLPMAGSSVHFDRRFLCDELRPVHDWFGYRNIDVSTLKETCKLLNPRVADALEKPVSRHRPIHDICDSIEEYKYYIDNYLFVFLEDDPS